MRKFIQTHKRKLQAASLFAGASGVAWWTKKCLHSYDILNNAFDASVVDIYEPLQQAALSKTSRHTAVWLEPNIPKPKGYLEGMAYYIRFILARRLLNIAQSDVQPMRLRAVEYLSKLKLDSWQYSLLAHMCDARTAVGIARVPGSRTELLLPPFRKFEKYNPNLFLHTLKDYLKLLDQSINNTHPCMKETVTKVFMDDDITNLVGDYGHEHISVTQKKYDKIPICLNSISHHACHGKYVEDIINHNGLFILMEAYLRYSDDIDICITLCNTIANLCAHQNILEELFQAGWIWVLAQWISHPDIRLAGPAAQALANLDADDQPDKLSGNLYLLHPMTRTIEKAAVDVVFVHGLLGNVFYTWRNNSSLEETLALIGKEAEAKKRKRLQESVGLDNSGSLAIHDKVLSSSDPATQEFAEEMVEQYSADWESIGSDFEFVYYDIPIDSNAMGKGPFCCSKIPLKNITTQCWARDWLPKDCKRLRVLGVNYGTTLFSWVPTCPDLALVNSLDQRSELFLNEFLAAGLGKRPIVWVTHSMGGLLIKNVLAMASALPEAKKICEQSKAIIFYGTPHLGSKLATLNLASSYLVMPSKEVQELREDSPSLLRIHQDFMEFLKQYPMKICSFVETKPMMISTIKLSFAMVDTASADLGVGEYYQIPLNHITICKPTNRNSFLYQKVVQVLNEVLLDVVPENHEKLK